MHKIELIGHMIELLVDMSKFGIISNLVLVPN